MTARIEKKNKSAKGVIYLPPSKSIYNRALIIRALCGDNFKISPAALANDSLLLEKLLSSDALLLDAEDAGTTFRFLTAYLAQKPGEWTLTGTERMKNRPIGVLVEALRQLGADISYVGQENFPPLKINGKKLKGGTITIKGNVSSQFISALLMIAPNLEGGLELNLQGEIFSKPYIDMTLRLMTEYGIESQMNGNVIKVKKKKYIPKDFFVESDWSAASYWYEVAAFSEEANIVLNGLNEKSVQGDSVIQEIMKQFGVRTELHSSEVRITKSAKSNLPKPFSYDFKSCPDLAQTLAATCAGLGIEASLNGVDNLGLKETDRLHAMQNELKQLGIPSNITPTSFHIPSTTINYQLSTVHCQTHNDHRMAMSLAPLALKFGCVEIENPEAVNKSYPGFWKDLEKVGFEITFL